MSGFQALATTSAGFAFSIGRGDGAVGREHMLAHVSAIAGATDLPVSADLENGFGDDVETVAKTIALAAAAGAVGGSIEDVSPRPQAVVYELAHAVDRVRAAAAAARALPFRFMLTARAENFIAGRPDLADTIARLQAYQDAGADVLYAPGFTTIDQIVTVVKSVDRPVNVLMGLPGIALDRAALSAAGVRRVSTGSALARAAYGAFLRGAREIARTRNVLVCRQGGEFARDFRDARVAREGTLLPQPRLSTRHFGAPARAVDAAKRRRIRSRVLGHIDVPRLAGGRRPL